MLKKYELENIIKDALYDIPDISDKPDEDGTYTQFEKEIKKDDNGDIIFIFTEEHNTFREKTKYKIHIEEYNTFQEKIIKGE